MHCCGACSLRQQSLDDHVVNLILIVLLEFVAPNAIVVGYITTAVLFKAHEDAYGTSLGICFRSSILKYKAENCSLYFLSLLGSRL